ncbi:hypothetical protein AB0J38_28200 [Streptomyces sp. NPDC050095]|uniref:hypothetical protein n=1 Tax=unclassified Streptomyces TaxID=2593676 RepID=UPI00342FBC63
MNSRAYQVRSSVVVSGTALFLAAAGFALAPTASATDDERGILSVSTNAPAEVALAGLPVEFTTMIRSVGPNWELPDNTARLAFRIDGGLGLSPNAVSLEYRLSGKVWTRVPLKYSHTDGQFTGEMPQFTVTGGGERTVQMRSGAPWAPRTTETATVAPTS